MSLDDLAELIGGLFIVVVTAAALWLALAVVLPWLAHPVVAVAVWSWRHGAGSW